QIVLVSTIGAAGTTLGAIVLAAFPRSILSAREASRASPGPVDGASNTSPTIAELTGRLSARSSRRLRQLLPWSLAGTSGRVSRNLRVAMFASAQPLAIRM